MEKISYAKRRAIEDAVQAALEESGTRVWSDDEAEGFPLRWTVTPGDRMDLKPDAAEKYADEVRKAAKVAALLNRNCLTITWKGMALEYDGDKTKELRMALYEAIREKDADEDAITAALSLAA